VPGFSAGTAGGWDGNLAQMRDLWQRGQARWSGLPSGQRNWAFAFGLLLAGTLAGLLWYATRTDWRTLYAGLDPDDARQIGQTLTQAQIPYDVEANGATLRVPLALLDKARLATAAKGGARSGRMGFELFDKPNWVGSEFDEQVNYQRALEGELEHTVSSLADVRSARVHLVLPHDSLFRDQERPAKASVVLALRHRNLADGEDEAIRNLVAAAVDGLAPAQVTLVDAAGNLPLGPKSGEAMRQGIEQALEAKLIETLEPVTGPGNVRASVTVDYDPTTTDVTEETYDPDRTVTLSMQRTEQSSGPQAVAAGVPGTASNAPNAQAKPVYPQQETPPTTAKSESGTYGASKTVRHSSQGPGHLRRLTAAVVVNDREAPGQNAGQGARQARWQPRTAEELRTLTALAQAAVGFDAGRGDLVTVQDLAFDQNRSAAAVSPLAQLLHQGFDLLEHSPVLVKYGSLLAGLLLLILLAIRPALRASRVALQGKTAELAAPKAQEALPGAVEAPTLERQRAQQVFDQVTETLKRDPTQSSRLLQSWIHSD
jgi:flagellar M-ring protein FliF